MCPINTYIKAVREKKNSVSEDTIVIFESDFFEYDASVTPAIPLPIMT
jgi:hypothetical protein